MAILKINGNNIKDPKTIEVGIQDVDYESGRDQTGKMFRDRVAVKRKISCTWQGLTSDEMQDLLDAMEDAKFSVTYHDPKTNANKTIYCYVGDRTMPVYTYINNKIVYQTLSANFVEY